MDVVQNIIVVIKYCFLFCFVFLQYRFTKEKNGMPIWRENISLNGGSKKSVSYYQIDGKCPV